MDKIPKKTKKMIKKLKQKFKIYGVDGYIIPKNDEFFSEYANPNRLFDNIKFFWISWNGFKF